MGRHLSHDADAFILDRLKALERAFFEIELPEPEDEPSSERNREGGLKAAELKR